MRAVKLTMRPGEQALGRFLREIQNLARIDHPNVATIHESGSSADGLWFAMELVEGTPLNQVLAREGPLPFERAMDIAIGICEGAAAIHAAGVIHRDLKPSNVVLAEDGHPVVIDLGLAVAPEQDERLTRTGAMVGTACYLAPEQITHAKQATPRSDVHALGCILFELVTGRQVMQGQGLHHILARILADARPVPSKEAPLVPASFDAVCLRAMAREPEDRYADAGEIVQALREVRDGPQEPASGRGRVVGLALGVLLLVVLAAIVGIPGEQPSESPESNERASEAEPKNEPAGPSPERIALGDERLTELKSVPAARRLERLERWLGEFPIHPRRDEAVALRGETLLHVPAQRWNHPGALTARFVGQDRLLSAGQTSIRLWRVGAAEPIKQWDTDHPVTAIAVAPDQRSFVWVSGRRPEVWSVDLESGVQRVLWSPASGRNHKVRFSRDGRALAVGGGQRVALLTLKDKGPPGVFTLSHRRPVRGVAFSPDGRWVVTLCGEPFAKLEHSPLNLVTLWDLRGPGREPREIRMSGVPKDVTFFPDGERFLVAGDSTRIAVFGLRDGKRKGQLKGKLKNRRSTGENPYATAAHDGGANHVAVGPRGWMFSASREANELRVWNPGSLVEVHQVTGIEQPPLELDITPDGQCAVLVLLRGPLEYWDMRHLSRR